MLGVSTKNTFFEKSTCEEYIDQYHKMLQKTQKKAHQVTRRRNFSIFLFPKCFVEISPTNTHKSQFTLIEKIKFWDPLASELFCICKIFNF